jgi:hypothetical protein
MYVYMCVSNHFPYAPLTTLMYKSCMYDPSNENPFHPLTLSTKYRYQRLQMLHHRETEVHLALQIKRIELLPDKVK